MTRLWAGGIWIKRIPSYIKDNPAKILGLPKTESRTARVSCISRCLPRSSIWDAACGLSLGFRISGLGFRINQAKKTVSVLFFSGLKARASSPPRASWWKAPLATLMPLDASTDHRSCCRCI